METAEQIAVQTHRSAGELAILAVLSLPSPASRRNYAREIRLWLEWGGQPTRESIQAFLAHLRAIGAGISKRNVTLSALKLFARECWERGQVSESELHSIERIRADKLRGQRVGNWLDIKQLQKLIDRARAGPNGARNAALIACMGGCGMRRAELCGLKWEQWRKRQGRWCWCDVQGKGGRVRTVAAPDWVAREVERWRLEAICESQN